MSKENEDVFSLPDVWEDILTSRSDKTAETRIWDLVRAYLEDRQNNLALDTRSNQLTFTNIMANVSGGRGRLQFNVLKTAYRTLVSMLTINVPGIRTRPASPSIDDIIKAQANEMAAQYWWHSEKLPEGVKKQLLPWLLTTGNAFIQVRYSKAQDKVIKKIVSPYDVYPEPNNIDPEECRWWALKETVSKKDLIKMYPDRKDYIESYAEESKRDQKGLYQDDKVPKNRVDIYTVYWKDGKCGVCLGEEWLYKSEQPTGFLTFFRYTYFAGKLWGHSPFVSAIDHQTAINRRKNMELDNAEAMSNSMWLVPTGSVTNPQSISNKPGKVVEFNALVGAPQRVMGVSMPVDFAAGTAQLQSDVYEMLGLNGVMLGKRVIGVGSGKGMEVLADKSTGQLQMTMSDLEIGLTEVTLNVLKLMKRYYTEGLLVQMMDDSGKVIHEELQNEQLEDNPHVFFQADSLFRQDIEDMEARTLDLYDRKLISPDETMKRLVYSLGNYQAAKKMKNWAHAQKLLAGAAGKLGSDKGIQIFMTDDLESITEVFNEFTQTDEFYTLPPIRQDYIAGVIAAVGAQGNLTPEQLAQATQKMIWPLQPHSELAAKQDLIATDSPQAQAQIQDQANQMQAKAMDMQSAQEGMTSQSPQGAMAGLTGA